MRMPIRQTQSTYNRTLTPRPGATKGEAVKPRETAAKRDRVFARLPAEFPAPPPTAGGTSNG